MHVESNGRWPPAGMAGSHRGWRHLLGCALVLACLGISACSPRLALVRGVADELAQQGGAEETDIGLARDAAAFYLKLSEGVLRQTPGHIGLAESVSGGFVQYAYAFIAQPAERLEAHNAAAAQQQRERAARMYHRAREHAMAALVQHQPGLRAALAAQVGVGAAPTAATAPESRFASTATSATTATLATVSASTSGGASRLTLAPELAGLGYWAAAAWGGEISLSKDDPEVVADLPQAMALAEAAWRAQPAYGQGALASLMGIFEASRPGGSAAKARPFFEQALRAGGPNGRASHLLAQAEYLAAPAGDREGFEALLKQTLQASEGRHDLMNQVAAERARWLLGRLDELF